MIKEVLGKLTQDEIDRLYQESVALDMTGCAAEDALLRTIAAGTIGNDNALDLMVVSREVYRFLAARFYESRDSGPHLLSDRAVAAKFYEEGDR